MANPIYNNQQTTINKYISQLNKQNDNFDSQSFENFVSQIQNPQQFAQQMLQQNKNAQQFISQLQQQNINPRELALQLAESRNINLLPVLSRFGLR